jgi:hypothetical protein
LKFDRVHRRAPAHQGFPIIQQSFQQSSSSAAGSSAAGAGLPLANLE